MKEASVPKSSQLDFSFLLLVHRFALLPKATYALQEDIAAAGQVVETTRDPMFRDPKTQEYLG